MAHFCKLLFHYKAQQQGEGHDTAPGAIKPARYLTLEKILANPYFRSLDRLQFFFLKTAFGFGFCYLPLR